MRINITNKNKEIILLPIDKKYNDFGFYMEGSLFGYVKDRDGNKIEADILDNFSGADYSIINILSKITNEQSEMLVDKKSGNPEEGYLGYWDYTLDAWGYCLETAKQSLISLLKKHKIDTEKEYLIILKK